MDFLINRYRNLTVLLMVVIGQLLLLAYQVKNNQDVRVIRVWAVSVVTPMARVLEFVRRNTIGIAEDYFVLVNVRDENVRLNKENGKLKLENQYLRNELSTADRVQALRVFQQRTPSRTLAARVIGNGTGANSQVVFIDRGSGSGILKGMPVVTPDGIVGKVLAAYPTASQVLLITDANFAAGVVSQKNHVHGTVVGLGQSKCMVKYIQNEEKVDQGEMFYTSGDDRLFPKGMPVGRATVVKPGRDFKEIYVEPSGWTSGLEEVLVVIEGVHQELPDTPPVSTAEVYLQSAPPADSKQVQKEANAGQALYTEADKLRDKYKKIGELENHKFGEGPPGSKPPDFNIDPDAATKAAAAKAAAAKAAAAAAAAGQPATKPPAGAPGQQTATAKPPAPKPALDANGNPIPVRPKVTPQLDANGNPIPAKPKPAPQLDANGNPVVAKPKPVPQLDAEGNPIVPKPKPKPPVNANATPPPGTVVDGNGRVIQAGTPLAKPKVTPETKTGPATKAPPRPTLDANGNPIPAKPKPKPPVLDANGNPVQTARPPRPPAATAQQKGSTVTSDKTTINVMTPPPGTQKPKAAAKPETDQ